MSYSRCHKAVFLSSISKIVLFFPSPECVTVNKFRKHCWLDRKAVTMRNAENYTARHPES